MPVPKTNAPADAWPIAYNVVDAARACGVSDVVLRRAIRSGELIARYPTSRPVILRTDLEAWLNATPEQRGA